MSRSILKINKKALQENVKALYEFTKKKVIAVIKADGYGIGATYLAKVLENIDYVDAYAVACVEEGIELRKSGFRKKILILGGILKQEAKYIQKFNLTPVVSHSEHLKALEGLDVRFHVKWDTGMGRLGFLEEAINDPRIEGIMTHLSTPSDEEFSKYQISKFERILKLYRKMPSIHIESSAGIVYKVPFATHIRIGLALHGEYPLTNYPINLSRVYTLKAKLLSVKKVPSNFPISYSRTYVTDKEKKIGVVAFGYADGLMKSLSNIGYLYYKGKPVKILGNVTMDMTMVDLDGSDAKVGDYIEIVGEHQSFTQLAKLAGTIPYEIMCNLSKRIKRVLY